MDPSQLACDPLDRIIRVVARIATGLLVVAFVCLLLTFFVPVEPWREATGTTYLRATYAFLVMLAVNLLVTAVVGLVRWTAAESTGPNHPKS